MSAGILQGGILDRYQLVILFILWALHGVSKSISYIRVQPLLGWEQTSQQAAGSPSNYNRSESLLELDLNLGGCSQLYLHLTNSTCMPCTATEFFNALRCIFLFLFHYLHLDTATFGNCNLSSYSKAHSHEPWWKTCQPRLPVQKALCRHGSWVLLTLTGLRLSGPKPLGHETVIDLNQT